MKKLKIGDLEKIRESVRKTASLRQGKARAKVTIHMGTCGIAAGARETMKAVFGVKNYIEENLCRELNMMMVQVPLIVDRDSGETVVKVAMHDYTVPGNATGLSDAYAPDPKARLLLTSRTRFDEYADNERADPHPPPAPHPPPPLATTPPTPLSTTPLSTTPLNTTPLSTTLFLDKHLTLFLF